MFFAHATFHKRTINWYDQYPHKQSTKTKSHEKICERQVNAFKFTTRIILFTYVYKQIMNTVAFVLGAVVKVTKASGAKITRSKKPFASVKGRTPIYHKHWWCTIYGFQHDAVAQQLQRCVE